MTEFQNPRSRNNRVPPCPLFAKPEFFKKYTTCLAECPGRYTLNSALVHVDVVSITGKYVHRFVDFFYFLIRIKDGVFPQVSGFRVQKEPKIGFGSSSGIISRVWVPKRRVFPQVLGFFWISDYITIIKTFASSSFYTKFSLFYMDMLTIST